MENYGEKPKFERVKECVHLLQQIKGLGITEHSAGYDELKSKMDDWVYKGYGFTGTIVFPKFLRKAIVVLPVKKNTTATIQLKTIT